MFDDYKLNRDRFKELKHFCRQYDYFLEMYESSKDGAERADLINAIELIETTAKNTDPIFFSHILDFVTKDVSYSEVELPIDELIFKYLICRFYWLLSASKGV